MTAAVASIEPSVFQSGIYPDGLRHDPDGRCHTMRYWELGREGRVVMSGYCHLSNFEIAEGYELLVWWQTDPQEVVDHGRG